MTTCNNCKKGLSCTCAQRIASNGMSCCAACLQQYEAHLRQELERIQQSINNANTPQQ